MAAIRPDRNPPYFGANGLHLEQPGPGDESLSILKRARGKRSIVLDLRAPGGRELLFSMLERADVLVDNFSPRALDGLGLQPETLLDRFPRLVIALHLRLRPHGPVPRPAGLRPGRPGAQRGDDGDRRGRRTPAADWRRDRRPRSRAVCGSRHPCRTSATRPGWPWPARRRVDARLPRGDGDGRGGRRLRRAGDAAALRQPAHAALAVQQLPHVRRSGGHRYRLRCALGCVAARDGSRRPHRQRLLPAGRGSDARR